MSHTDNPREVIGGNQPQVEDYAKQESERLARDYVNLTATCEELLKEAHNAPKEVNDDATAGVLSDLIVRIRSFDRRVEGIREAEKEPFLRRGNAVQQFFMTIRLKLARDKKTDPAGASDILHARVHDWNERKLAAERARLAEIERQERELARKAREEQDELNRQAAEAKRRADEAAAAAERARKAENIQAQQAAADAAAEEQRLNEAAAARAGAEAAAAQQRADDAKIDASRKPADHVRTRTAGGTMNTMKQVPDVQLVDKSLVDLDALRPYLRDSDVEFALKQWAKSTDHKVQMDGAIVRMVNATVQR